MKHFIRVMKALSDPNRVRIIKLLGRKELCVCEIQSLLELAQSTVSKHMKLLEEAGMVEFRKDGSWIIYQLTDGEESAYAKVMIKNLSDWLDDDLELQNMILKLALVDQERICAA
ncbi:MAG: winged helix-turn-helix transcriptional regulator [Desulfocapsa sp.]|nr:winged helix-turn-helix transcriptional regulator [Desulfocapsa sp.]